MDSRQTEEGSKADAQPLPSGVGARLVLGLNLLSLDAPIVSVLWAWLFAASLGISLLPGSYPTLFCAVWTIYLFDRLLDTRPSREAIPLTARHFFFRRHWKAMFCLGIVASGIGAWNALMVAPAPLIGSGALLSGLVASYFLLRMIRHRYISVLALLYVGFIVLIFFMFLGLGLWAAVPFSWLLLTFGLKALYAGENTRGTAREMLCGLLFALGTALPAFWHISDSIFPFRSDTFAIPIEMLNEEVFLFGLLCSLNCIGISIWEQRADAGGRDDGAIAQYFPAIGKAYIPLVALLVATTLFWRTGSTDSGYSVRMSIATAALGLAIVHSLRGRLQPQFLRVLGDAVLLSPLGFIPFT